MSNVKLQPPTTVVVDLFGLSEAEAARVKTKILGSGVPVSCFVLVGE